MLTLERVAFSPTQWDTTLASYSDRTLHQTSAWLGFLGETQNGEVVVAELRDGLSVVGHFSGLIVRRFGCRFLGSPLPGWTTSYMGFNLREGVSRSQALQALRKFAFHQLGCVHFEIMDRHYVPANDDPGFLTTSYNGFQVDLSLTEEQLFAAFKGQCRTCVRKATKSGITIEMGGPEGFVEDYYEQLRDVFAKQGLFPTYHPDRVHALIRHLWPTGNVLLCRARDAAGRCIASGIYTGFHDRAYFWGGASWREQQAVRPNELLIWETIRKLKRRGYRYLDMGGAGEYKRKYGGQEISVPWLRTSRYPLMPQFRNAMASVYQLRQRWKFSSAQGLDARV